VHKGGIRGVLPSCPQTFRNPATKMGFPVKKDREQC
jgi:hypothetical protein